MKRIDINGVPYYLDNEIYNKICEDITNETTNKIKEDIYQMFANEEKEINYVEFYLKILNYFEREE